MENKKRTLGIYARRVLLYTLPLMVFFTFALTVYVARLDVAAFMHQEEMILLLLSTLGRLLFCISLGAVLADIAERKTKDHT
ncbi:MAG: hypothetical protein IJ489_03565 [Clostridia bacterium]|nr:hypothetical protein [Clostridia bacterium]